MLPCQSIGKCRCFVVFEREKRFSSVVYSNFFYLPLSVHSFLSFHVRSILANHFIFTSFLVDWIQRILFLHLNCEFLRILSFFILLFHDIGRFQSEMCLRAPYQKKTVLRILHNGIGLYIFVCIVRFIIRIPLQPHQNSHSTSYSSVLHRHGLY